MKVDCEVWILAGGVSRRMGRDKSRIKVQGRGMLARVRSAALATGLKVRVIRKDIVPRCGPLGGIVTGLTKSRSQAVLFLPCDMPFVSTELIRWVIRNSIPRLISSEIATNRCSSRGDEALTLPFLADSDYTEPPHVGCYSKGRRAKPNYGVFICAAQRAGFPFCLSRKALGAAKAQVAAGDYSLQSFARVLNAHRLKLPKKYLNEIRNFNSPADLENLAKASALP